ncbi:MAG: TSUP family transporter [Actinomycetales bacterium]|nr:TSUP family transporter [Actinomycetales bacterium]
MDFLTVTLFALVGASAQFVDGLLGMGFDITSASLLTVLGYSAVAASAGTHAAKVGTTLVSGVSHWREGNVDWRVLITVGVPGAIGAFIGAVVLTSIALDGARIWMAAILFLLGLTIIARFGYDKSLFPAMKLRTRNLWPIGLFGGFVDATGGGGWGPVATPSLMTVTKHKPHRIVGTVSASEFLVAASASIGFLFGAGEAGVPWLAVLGLVIGGVITAPIAARLAKKAPTAPLGVAVGGMVLIANTVVIASVLAISGAISAAIVAVELVITIAIVIQVVKRTPAPT